MKLIYSEWLDTEIGVFRGLEEYQKAAKKNKFEPYDAPTGTSAFYQWLTTETGATLFVMCFIIDEIPIKTVVHECSHVVDAIFEWRGFNPCTETRAYFLAWLFNETYNYLKKVA